MGDAPLGMYHDQMTWCCIQKSCISAKTHHPISAGLRQRRGIELTIRSPQVYDNALRAMAAREGRSMGDAPLGMYFSAGAVGGAMITFITCPASLIKIQLQVGWPSLRIRDMSRGILADGIMIDRDAA
jgi:hypothetical protein